MIPLRDADYAGWRLILWLDLALLVLVRRCERRALTPLMKALTHAGDTPSWLLLTAALAASGGDGPLQAALLATGAGLALLVSQALKRVCCRPRPSEAPGDAVCALADDPDAFSFPSGHTAVAFGVAVALAGQGGALGEVALALACGIGASRVYLGAHYPLDVAAGALLGTGAGWLAQALVA
ncbi:MAG TPA: phosphatase PAP2 family protein [Thermoanaerobaculia bacterium]|nr:phosphatase PAP2 family protein [Thermoanaerobaculia bacterium]